MPWLNTASTKCFDEISAGRRVLFAEHAIMKKAFSFHHFSCENWVGCFLRKWYRAVSPHAVISGHTTITMAGDTAYLSTRGEWHNRMCVCECVRVSISLSESEIVCVSVLSALCLPQHGFLITLLVPCAQYINTRARTHTHTHTHTQIKCTLE